MTLSIKRHPDISTLMSFAAGSLAESLSAAIAAHVSVCDECRKELRCMERLGGVLLSDLRTSGTGSPTLRRPQLHVGDTFSAARVIEPAAPADKLPRPVAERYGLTFDTIAWRRLGIGVWHYRLPLSEGAAGDLRLLKIGPGRKMPMHGHGGDELTLVLDGSYHDETGEYRRGDMQDVDDEIEHTPVSDAETGCVCLIASEHPARFKGIVGRLMQPLTGM